MVDKERDKSHGHARRRNNDPIIYERGNKEDNPLRMQELKKPVLSRVYGIKSNQSHSKREIEGVNRVPALLRISPR